MVSTRRQSRLFALPPLASASSRVGKTNRSQNRSTRNETDTEKTSDVMGISNARGPGDGESDVSDHNSNSNVSSKDVPPRPEHFLQGVQLQNCKDLLSIPDPPSPPTMMTRQRRRLSTPVMQLQPLRDMTNGDEDDVTLSALQPSSRPKRLRKSLCHVPSPIELEERGTEETVTRRRKKKRQSMLLPSDDSQEGSLSDQIFPTFKAPHANTKEPLWDEASTSPEVSFLQNSPPENPDEMAESLFKVRQLIRSYTSSPSPDGALSLHIQKIEEVSGYVVTPPMTSSEDAAHPSQQVPQQRKADLFGRLAPDLKRLDKGKRKTAKMVEEVTACRVDKNSRGKVRYQHVPTGRKIQPAEYEQRYMLMLDEITSIRSQSWADYFRQIQNVTLQTASACPSDVDCEEMVAEASLEEPNTPQPPTPNEDSSTEVVSLPEEDAEVGSHIRGESVAAASEDHRSEGLDTCIDDYPSEATNRKDLLSRTDDLASSHCHESTTETPVSSPEVVEDIGDASSRSGLALTPQSPSRGLLLPFPSRDESSEDPAIAEAEARLWRSIDHALEKYSEEVFAIQRARAASTSRQTDDS